jgi:hypothetical protein
MYLCIYAHACVRARACVYLCVCVYVRVCVCVCVCGWKSLCVPNKKKPLKFGFVSPMARTLAPTVARHMPVRPHPLPRSSTFLPCHVMGTTSKYFARTRAASQMTASCPHEVSCLMDKVDPRKSKSSLKEEVLVACALIAADDCPPRIRRQ